MLFLKFTIYFRPVLFLFFIFNFFIKPKYLLKKIVYKYLRLLLLGTQKNMNSHLNNVIIIFLTFYKFSNNWWVGVKQQFLTHSQLSLILTIFSLVIERWSKIILDHSVYLVHKLCIILTSNNFYRLFAPKEIALSLIYHIWFFFQNSAISHSSTVNSDDNR